jgi:hypothetical protein
MAYSDFTTLTKVREAFGLTIEESIDLFTDTPEVLPSSHLETTLNENVFFSYGNSYRKGAGGINYYSDGGMRDCLYLVRYIDEVRRY